MVIYDKQPFDIFMSQLKETNATLDFFCDFNKISKNVADISISLHMLNYLIGKKDLRSAVKALWERDPRVFDVMQILIAVRKKDKKKYLREDGSIIPIQSLFTSIDGVMEFIMGTGLNNLFQKPEINDLVDYVFGVETGLDSNARKNRSGHTMETWVENIFINNNIPYKREVQCNKLPNIKEILGMDIKRFDFVVPSKVCTYLIEVNFYSEGGGSKPSEVARAYSELSPKINSTSNYKFVWITDGKGWNGVNSFKEAYEEIPLIYNLTNIDRFVEMLKTE